MPFNVQILSTHKLEQIILIVNTELTNRLNNLDVLETNLQEAEEKIESLELGIEEAGRILKELI